MRATNLTTYAYEALQTKGLQFISDADLRGGIARMYDHHYVNLGFDHEVEQEVVLQVLRPYFLTKFRDLRIFENATPIDYEAVMSDPYFRNILHYRLDVLHLNQLKNYPLVIAEMNQVLEQLDSYLAE